MAESAVQHCSIKAVFDGLNETTTYVCFIHRNMSFSASK